MVRFKAWIVPRLMEAQIRKGESKNLGVMGGFSDFCHKDLKSINDIGLS
jgi:hypothetical protein